MTRSIPTANSGKWCAGTARYILKNKLYKGVLDYSSVKTKRDFLKRAKEFGFKDRVMFGSDQMIWPHGIEMSIEYLNSLSFLSEVEKRGILFHNAARFLKLDQSEMSKYYIQE